MRPTCILHDLPVTPYAEAWRLQKNLLAAMKDDPAEPEHLVLVEHPRVITVGRRGKADELKRPEEELGRAGFEVFHINRGGKTTYHGPGQLVGYPLVRLNARKPDVHRYLRMLEELLIRVAGRFGVESGRREGLTGTWIGERKLASIGVGISRWITYHGFALNVATNLDDFRVIDPCGLGGVEMTSLVREAARAVPMNDVRKVTIDVFTELFEVEMIQTGGKE